MGEGVETVGYFTNTLVYVRIMSDTNIGKVRIK